MSMLAGLVSEDDRGMRRGGRVRVSLDTGKESFVQQSMKNDCDINHILKRYEKDKAITHLNRYGGRYEDVTGVVGYHEAQNAVVKANEMFLTLPARVRDRFHNDPGLFLEFATNPQNVDELVTMGLASKVHKEGEVVETPPPPKREDPVLPK